MKISMACSGDKDADVEVWLEDFYGDGIAMMARKKGQTQSWYIVQLHKDGNLRRFTSVPKSLGLELEGDSVVKVSNKTD